MLSWDRWKDETVEVAHEACCSSRQWSFRMKSKIEAEVADRQYHLLKYPLASLPLDFLIFNFEKVFLLLVNSLCVLRRVAVENS